MLCGTPEAQRGAVADSEACAEAPLIGLPHGLLTVVALPFLALGCFASQILYSVL